MSESRGAAVPPRTGRARRIVIATWGSLGDLHPYLAIGLGLRARCHDVIIATGECYRQKIERLGLGFHSSRPDCDWVADPDIMRWLTHPRWSITRAIRVPLNALRESYEDLSAAVNGADLLVGNMAAYAARLVAEKRGMPWVSAMHIPTGFFSAYDPPLMPGFSAIAKRLRCLGPPFWGPLGRSLKWLLRPLARDWYRLRKQLGLPPAEDLNPLTDGHSPRLHLALFSKWLVDMQPDWPASTLVTGFPWFDGEAQPGLSRALTRFMDAGPPPVVFTLGTAVASDPRGFYDHSLKAVQRLGCRAVLILKDAAKRTGDLPAGVLACDYAPFSALFPRAAAIVHHGGIGTTGLAMRSGRPMLVMPCAWDQPDNAERVARLGIARVIARDLYTPTRVATELRSLLRNTSYGMRAAELGGLVRQEDGVRKACEAIGSLLERAVSV